MKNSENTRKLKISGVPKKQSFFLEILELEIKKSDIKREKAKLVLDKCVWLYFLFMVVGAIGFVYGYVNPKMLNFMIVASFIILIIGTMPYVTTVAKEEKKIDEFIKTLKNSK